MMKFIPVLSILFFSLLSGCATLDGPTEEHDPFESFNRSMYSFNAGLDQYVLKPVAEGYVAVTPAVARKGVSNFFSNLDDVLVVVNDLLQFKFKQFASDLGRLLINSTLGIYGLIDWSSDLGLPKHDEDFGQTLGYWGVSNGPYLVLPLFGPTTVRDGTGNFVERSSINPIREEVYEGRPFPNRESETANTLSVLSVVDARANLLRAGNLLEEVALDPYIFVREAYLQRRQNLVYDGNPPEDEYDDDYDSDEEAELESVSQVSDVHKYPANPER